MMFGLLKTNLLKQFDTETGNYEGYSDTFIMLGGTSVALGAIVLGVLFSLGKWHKDHAEFDEHK
jgi:NSS family neurotransmitter:Na+ symporter